MTILTNIKSKAKNFILGRKYDGSVKKKFENSTLNKRIIMIGTPNFGNLGDHAIAEAEKVFFEKYFPTCTYLEFSFYEYMYAKKSIETQIKPDDLICIHGGGYLGSLWPSAQEMANSILQLFPSNNIILFPQTIFFDQSLESKNLLMETARIFQSHKHLTVFLRDENSFDFFKSNMPNVRTYLVPDIVTNLDESKPDSRNNILFCLRTDKEKIDNSKWLKRLQHIVTDLGLSYAITDTVIEEHPTDQNRKHYLNLKFAEFRSAKLIITDRLHGMIFSLITGTPCIAMNNVSKKVEGAYYWFKHIDYIKLVNEDSSLSDADLTSLVSYMLNLPPQKYQANQIVQNFSSLIKQIENDLS